jgi:adenylate cyclase
VRYLKVSIFIGLLVSLLVIVLLETGCFARLDQTLARLLELRVAPHSSRKLHYALGIFFAFGIAWTTIDIARDSLKLVIALGALVQVVAAVWVANLLGLFFSPFASFTAIAGSAIIGLFYAQTEAGSRKRLLRQVLGDRVSGATFHTLLDAPLPPNLEGERRDVTVVVCEIFNHDDLEEALTAPDYVALTNSFRRNASELLVERGGYLDECDGESIRVIFGAPLAQLRHAAAACDAALALVRRLEEVNRECHTVWKQMFDFRIGVNSGEMTLAAYGSRRLGAYSVAGEPAEFARRLCRANLIYGTRILLGSQTLVFAEDAVEVRPMELIQRFDDGASREEIYELLAPHNTLTDEQRERRDTFWKAVIRYREQSWNESLALFHSARTPGGTDGPVEFYIRRIEQLRAGLPSLDWHTARL